MIIFFVYPFGSHNKEFCMCDVGGFYTLEFFSSNIADARLMKQQLLLSSCWYLTVCESREEVGCVVFLAGTIGEENIGASVSDCPAK